MVSTQFAAILRDLEPYFKCKLQPDTNNSCIIQLKSGIEIQIEPRGSDQLLIGVKLGIIPASAYQEKVFRAALRSNDIGPPSKGMFGWSKKSANLIHFMLVDIRSLIPEKLMELLKPFIAKSKLWHDTIKNGDVPFIEEAQGHQTSKPNLFGLIH